MTAEQLIQGFKYALDQKWGYIYGTSGGIWTQAEQDKATREQTVKWGQKWVGKHVADCSGLFVYACKQYGYSIAHGSNSIWNKHCSAKGTLTNGKKADGSDLLPATAVFKTSGTDRHHIGLYIGGGKVIEAKGTYYGVVSSNVADWDEWGELICVIRQEKPKEGQAIVTKTKVALRAEPSKTAKVLTRVDIGKAVDLLPLDIGWHKVKFGNTVGYMIDDCIDFGGTGK